MWRLSSGRPRGQVRGEVNSEVDSGVEVEEWVAEGKGGADSLSVRTTLVSVFKDLDHPEVCGCGPFGFLMCL